MKVFFAGGGTAGHVNPAISIAQYIKARHPDADIHFIGNKNSLEEKLVKTNGYKFHIIEVSGLRRSLSPKNVDTIIKLFSAQKKVKELLMKEQPDLVIGTGGYVSYPVLSQATKLRIPTAIHEQNAYPGVTSKMLSRKVDRVMISFEDSRSRFPSKAKIELVGNPIREEFVFGNRSDARKLLNIDENEKYIVSFAGSLGAREFNNAMIDFIDMHTKKDNYKHTHATGKFGIKWMPGKLKEKGITKEKYPKIDIREYIDNMPVVMAAADIVIGRGGASTISEILALGKPSILIPSPNVTHNHQYYNVLSLVKNKAAIMIEEKELSGEKLYNTIKEILQDESKLNELSVNSHKMAIYDSSQKIYNIVTSLIK